MTLRETGVVQADAPLLRVVRLLSDCRFPEYGGLILSTIAGRVHGFAGARVGPTYLQPGTAQP